MPDWVELSFGWRAARSTPASETRQPVSDYVAAGCSASAAAHRLGVFQAPLRLAGTCQAVHSSSEDPTVAMTPEHISARLESSREAALALVEDVAYLREVTTRTDASPAELRRLSAVLRRLLIDDDLLVVAAPRIGKVLLNAPDIKPVYKAEGNLPYLFFGAGGASIFGVYAAATICDVGPARPMPDYDPDRIASVRVDSFLAQRVLCLRGEWVSRRAAIKFIANIASGVHSDAPKTDEERILASIRRCATVRMENGMPNFTVNMGAVLGPDPPFRHTQNAVDPVLLEVLAAAHYLVGSPAILALEASIVGELSLHA